MFDISTFPKADAVRRAAQLSQDDYHRLYRESIEHPSTFWAEQANRFLDWSAPWQTVQRYDLKTGEASWFAGGQLNVSYNCIDRHLEKRGDQTAIIWEGDDP
ncbi:acetyl-coenzyme A synthetase, partial [Pseudomonas sp. MWU12-2312b]